MSVEPELCFYGIYDLFSRGLLILILSIDSVMSLIIMIADPKNNKVVYLCDFVSHDNIKKTSFVLFAIGTIIYMSFLAKPSTIKKNIFWHQVF